MKGEEEVVKQRLPTKAKTVRIKKQKDTIEIKNTNTDPPPATLPAGSSFSQPSIETADAEAAYGFDSQGADETLR